MLRPPVLPCGPIEKVQFVVRCSLRDTLCALRRLYGPLWSNGLVLYWSPVVQWSRSPSGLMVQIRFVARCALRLLYGPLWSNGLVLY
jgi:hypothetical protein